MRILVYGEPLKTRTSGTPFRGLLRQLVQLRSTDEFVLLTRRNSREDGFTAYSAALGGHVKRLTDSRTKTAVDFSAFLGRVEHGHVTASADVYLNFDMGSLGASATPLIGTVADLSSILRGETSSLSWRGRRLRRQALRSLARHGSHVVAISESTRQDLEAHDGRFRGRTSVVPCGIEPDWYDREPAPQRTGLATPFWLWWGHASRRKNLGRVLRAYAQLVAGGLQPPEFHVIGTLGRDVRRLPSLASSLRIRKRVRFLDPQPLDELITLVDFSEGLIFPSLHEGFGLPVVEALARGKPVLTANRSALPEVGGPHVLLCDPFDIDAITEGMRRLLEERDAPGTASARRKWAGQFTHARAAASLSQIIDRVVCGENRRLT